MYELETPPLVPEEDGVEWTEEDWEEDEEEEEEEEDEEEDSSEQT